MVLPQLCSPKDLICYGEFLTWVRGHNPEDVGEIEAEVEANPRLESGPFVCNNGGSGYQRINTVCSPCDERVTIVETGDDVWSCRGCNAEDEHLSRRCVRDGVRGMCHPAGLRLFECR